MKAFNLFLATILVASFAVVFLLIFVDSADEDSPSARTESLRSNTELSTERPKQKRESYQQARENNAVWHQMKAIDYREPSPSELDDLSITSIRESLNGDAQSALVALELVRELVDPTQEELFSLFDAALDHEAPQVRAEAIETATGRFDGDYAKQFLSKAVTDENPYVGLVALEKLEQMPAPVRHPVMREAVLGAQPYIAEAVLDTLDVETNHQSIAIVMDALDSSVEGISEQARTTLDLLFDVNFANASEARNWWTANRPRFDGDLVER